jgi:hypothetical protein
MPNHMTVLALIGHGVWKVLMGEMDRGQKMHGRFSKPAGRCGDHHHSLSSRHKKSYINYMHAQNRIILVAIGIDLFLRMDWY